jgi:hypothetical protein
MANTVLLKRSSTPGKVPTTGQMSVGELAFNTYDGKLYGCMNSGTASVVQLGGAAVSSFSGGTTGLTPSSATTGAITLAGTLAVANGGTGVTSSTGTGSVVLSASPTLTGTLNGAAASFTGAATFGTSSGSLLVGNNPTQTYGSSVGYMLGLQATSGTQTCLSIALPSNALDSTGIVLGIGSSSAFLTVRDNKPFTISTNNTIRVTTDASGNTTFNSTGTIQVPVGTTAQRPTAVQGMIRYNTDRGCFEGYTGSAWVNMSPLTIDAVGATA